MGVQETPFQIRLNKNKWRNFVMRIHFIRNQPRPLCRAMCCVYNEHDACMKCEAGKNPGYRCPDFLMNKEDAVEIEMRYERMTLLAPSRG